MPGNATRPSIHRLVSVLLWLLAISPARAQEKQGAAGHEGHLAAEHAHEADAPQDASGTAWLPAVSPMYAFHWQAGEWSLMAHGTLFIQHLDDAGRRGRDQTGSTNWAMLMAERPAAGGRLGLRAMGSLEPWTVGGCGYPDLLALGEACEQGVVQDAQHPHDLWMELSARYERPLRGAVRWQAYVAAAGEPALGPVEFRHRPSSYANPLAPIGHHWLDSTHVSYGVVTGGLFTSRWKAEASAFNGREPDHHRTDLDFGPFDSFSGRLSFAASPGIVLQVSGGHLTNAGGAHAHAGGMTEDFQRVTTSALLQRRTSRTLWATTAAWGRNIAADGSTDSVLAESSLALRDRDTVFGRVELGTRPQHAFNFHGLGGTYTVAKLQGGYVRYLRPIYGLQSGVGVTVSTGVVAEPLEGIYGGRATGGFGVFFTMRPADTASR